MPQPLDVTVPEGATMTKCASFAFTGHVEIALPNGYVASVCRSDRPWLNLGPRLEFAAKHGGRVVYDTPVTNDVIGNLTLDETNEFVRRLAELPPRK